MQINTDNFILFVGYPRSGHTIVANILNSHPNILISDEVGIMKFSKLTKEKIRNSIIKKSNEVDIKYTSVYGNVNYTEDNIEKNKITIFGDKHANKNTMFINSKFDKIYKLNDIFNLNLIHVIRNPYDMITTNFIRRGRKWDNNIYKIINHFNTLFKTVENIKEKYDMFDIYLEDLIKYPYNNITELFHYVGIQRLDNEFLSYVSSKLLDNANKSRILYDWQDDQKQLVQNMISKYKFLKGYKWEK